MLDSSLHVNSNTGRKGKPTWQNANCVGYVCKFNYYTRSMYSVERKKYWARGSNSWFYRLGKKISTSYMNGDCVQKKCVLWGSIFLDSWALWIWLEKRWNIFNTNSWVCFSINWSGFFTSDLASGYCLVATGSFILWMHQ